MQTVALIIQTWFRVVYVTILLKSFNCLLYNLVIEPNHNCANSVLCVLNPSKTHISFSHFIFKWTHSSRRPFLSTGTRKWVRFEQEIYYRQLNFGKQNPLLSQFTYLLWLRPMLVFGTPVVFFLLLFEREKRLCKYRWLSVWFNWHGKNVDNGIRFWEKQTDYACMTTDECVHSGCGWGVRTTNPLQCECHAMQD